MRFKIPSFQNTALIACALYVLHLGFSKSLNYYIHPRYITFTVVMSTIALILLVHSGKLTKHNHSVEEKHNSKLSLVPLVIVLVFAFTLPEKSLTSSTISQRAIDSGLQSTTNISTATTFSGSSRGLKLSDWSRLLATHTEPSFYTTKPAKISGIVYDAGLGEDTIWVARFVLTCCAVDAQPIGVPVRIEGWRDNYAQNQWIEVEGLFREQQTEQGIKIVLVPEQITKIEEPDNPYAN